MNEAENQTPEPNIDQSLADAMQEEQPSGEQTTARVSSEDTEMAETLPRPTLTQLSVLFVVAGIVIVLDQLSKYIVEAALPLQQSWAPFPAIASFFRFTHVTNTGAAFGIFPAGSAFFTIMALIVSLAIIYYNFTLPAGSRMLRLALGLQLGGAIGNLLDRLRLGYVTDFLDFGPWPVFNLADTSIVAGVMLLGWLMFQEQRQEIEKARQREAELAMPLGGEGEESGKSVERYERRIDRPGMLDEWPAD